jgi:sterol desaturase/sphingolipid hydroxylase (fatty acid hydroxylase superfamily)
MHKLAGLIIAFLVLSLVFAAIERLFPSIPGQKRLRRGFWTDVGYWFFTPFVSQPAGVVAVAVAVSLVFQIHPHDLKAFILSDRHSWITTHLPAWAQAVLLLVIGDLVSYWMHRLFHGRRLWKFHAVHHCSEDLDWLSSVRLHPVNEALSKAVVVVVLLGLGFQPGLLAAFLPVFAFYAIMNHANVSWDLGWLGQVIASPRFHRWHHTSQKEGLDKNFAGMFPWIDRIFGTYYMPEGKQPLKFGLYGEKIPDSLWGQMVYPFRKKSK